MKKILSFLRSPIFWIFILALIIRVYKLEIFPYGFHVDEVKVGWNAYSIFKTGHDDNDNYFPLYYNSFGDFRPTGIFYLTIPSLILFGNSIFAVRIVSALFGALTVFPIYLLSKNFFKNKFSLVASFLLAISPWHIEVSRATSEAIISMFFALFALYFFTKLQENKQKKYIYLTVVFFLISYLFYHSIRMLAPIFTLILFIKLPKTKFTFITLGLVSLLSISFILSSDSLKRMQQITISGDIDYQYELQRLTQESPNRKLFNSLNNPKIVWIKRFAYQYGSYFSTNFLIADGARPNRYTTPGAGLVGYVEILLFITGIIYLLKTKKNSSLLYLLLASPLPAALTIEDSPNLHRSLFMVAFICIISSFGFYALSKNIRKLFLVGLVLNFIYFGYMYLYHSYNHHPYIKNYSMDSPTYRDIGAIEVIKKLDEYSKKYDKVVVSNFPDSLYPWYAFLTNKNPKEFNKKQYKNIVFSDEKCASDNSYGYYEDENILTIDSWQCGYMSKIKDGLPVQLVEKFLRPDGSEAYIVLSRKYTK